MRPIEFRAQRADTREWVYGNLFVPNENIKGVYICPEASYVDCAPGYTDDDDSLTFEEAQLHGCALGRFIEVIPETVGQFTGRNDANGKKIFEGDKDESGYFIQYVDEYACFCYLDKDLNVAFQCVPTFFEVIGTIHDKPEKP